MNRFVLRLKRWILPLTAALLFIYNVVTRLEVNRLQADRDQLNSEVTREIDMWTTYDNDRQLARKLHRAGNDSVGRLFFANRNATESLEDLIVPDENQVVVQDQFLHDRVKLPVARNSRVYLPPGEHTIEVLIERQWGVDEPTDKMTILDRFQTRVVGPIKFNIEAYITAAVESELVVKFSGVTKQVAEEFEFEERRFALESLAVTGWSRELPRFVQSVNELTLDDYAGLSEGVLPRRDVDICNVVIKLARQRDGEKGALRLTARLHSDGPLLVSPSIVEFSDYYTRQIQKIVEEHTGKPLKSIQEMFKRSSGTHYELQPHVIEAIRAQ